MIGYSNREDVGEVTPHFARSSFLLLLPKLPPIKYDSLIFINHKVHTIFFHGFTS